MQEIRTHKRVVDSPKVWTSLITNIDYLPGILTLHHSLLLTETKYPLVVLYTASSFPEEGLRALQVRNIPVRPVDAVILARSEGIHENDPRFYDAWTKFSAFSLAEYERVVNLDSDMLVMKNMDELMDIPLDDPPAPKDNPGEGDGVAGLGCRVLAAGHACLCNPLKKAHYPKNWIPSNCAFTAQHQTPETAATTPPSVVPVPHMNSGLLVINPSHALYARLLAHSDSPNRNTDFADQGFLSAMLEGRWVGLPYVYNAIKTLRPDSVHGVIWKDEDVKNVHYIMLPKPWDELDERGEWTGTDETHKWWADVNAQRKERERKMGISDGL